MQAVADGDAQDDGPEAQGHQGHVSLDPVHAGEGENGPVDDGDDLLPDESPAVEAQEEDDEDDQERDSHGHDQVAPDGAGVGNAPEGRPVHEDADVRMGGLVGLPLLGEEAVKPLGGPGIQRGEARGQESQRHGLVRAEEMTVLDRITAGGTALVRKEFSEKDVAESQRVHGNELRRLARHVLLEGLPVLLHGLVKCFRFQRFLETGVQGRVDERRQVLESIVHRPEHRAHVDGMQDPRDEPPGRIPLEQVLREFLHGRPEGRRIRGIPRIGRRNLDEYLVFQSYVAESQFIVRAGTRQELDDVLLVTETDAEGGKQKETACEQQVQQPLVLLEEVINRYEYPVHCWKFQLNPPKLRFIREN